LQDKDHLLFLHRIEIESFKEGWRNGSHLASFLLRSNQPEGAFMITSIQSVMTRKLITVPMDQSLMEAAELMKERRLRHLPVTNRQGEIVGLLSQADLQFAMQPENEKVENLMSGPIDFVEEDLSLRQATLLMLQKRIPCLFVVDEKKNTVGIVTTDDLLWHLAHLLAEETEEKPILGARERQTIGEIAHELSLMGI
jgi:CBS domain-containing protein